MRETKITEDNKVACSNNTMIKLSECNDCEGLISIDYLGRKIMCAGKTYQVRT